MVSTRSSRVCPVATARPSRSRQPRPGGGGARARLEARAGATGPSSSRCGTASAAASGAAGLRVGGALGAAKLVPHVQRLERMAELAPARERAASSRRRRRRGRARAPRQRAAAAARSRADALDQPAVERHAAAMPACVGRAELDVARVQPLGLVVVAGRGSGPHAPLQVGQPQLEPPAQRLLAAQLVAATGQREGARPPHQQELGQPLVGAAAPARVARALRAAMGCSRPRPRPGRPRAGRPRARLARARVHRALVEFEREALGSRARPAARGRSRAACGRGRPRLRSRDSDRARTTRYGHAPCRATSCR